MEIKNKINDLLLKGIDEKGNEKTIHFSQIENENVIIYFYPKDNTPGCTVEACDFRDNFNRLTGKATVIGVSPDGVESHRKFQKDHSLNFFLASDTDHSLAKTFGALKEGGGINRSTFLIKNGILEKKWNNVSVKGHVEEVLSFI